MKKPERDQDIDDVRQAIDSEDPELALEKALKLSHRYPNDPEALLALASAALNADVPQVCREACQQLLQIADHLDEESTRDLSYQADSYLVALEFRMWELEQAEDRLRRLLPAVSDNAGLWHRLAALLELTGRWKEGRTADQEAARLDPENYPLPVQLTEDELEQATREALEKLPPPFQDLLREVPIVIEEFPDREMSTSSGEQELPVAPDTLGLFVGTSLLDRSFFNAVEPPGTIFLFKRNLERQCPDRETLIEEITVTLWHELAHFLGFEEEDMPRLGLD